MTTESTVLAYYDLLIELVVECETHWVCNSCAHQHNTRHAHIETECLATVFAFERFHLYTFGRGTIVDSDHRPLESIVKKPLDKTPRRLQGIPLRMLQLQRKTCILQIHSECHTCRTVEVNISVL